MASGADQVMSRPASGMMPGLPRIDDQEMRTVVAAQLEDGRRSTVRRQLGESYYNATYVELRTRRFGGSNSSRRTLETAPHLRQQVGG